MYAVKIDIYTDDDFGYEDPEFNLSGEEDKIFYFDCRKEAVNALVNSFHNFNNSIRVHNREHIKRWVNSMDNRIGLISKKIPTFSIKKDFGNQSILYELLEVNKVELNNGSYYYDAKEPEVDFSWYEEETIRWDELANWDDVESSK